MIDALIYEWHESAIAIASPELAAAFNAETDDRRIGFLSLVVIKQIFLSR